MKDLNSKLNDVFSNIMNDLFETGTAKGTIELKVTIEARVDSDQLTDEDLLLKVMSADDFKKEPHESTFTEFGDVFSKHPLAFKHARKISEETEKNVIIKVIAKNRVLLIEEYEPGELHSFNSFDEINKEREIVAKASKGYMKSKSDNNK